MPRNLDLPLIGMVAAALVVALVVLHQHSVNKKQA